MVALQELLDFVAGEVGRRDVAPVPLSLVRLLGSAGGGLFVARLLVWTEKEADADGWVAVTAREWQAATMLEPDALRAVVRRCRALGFLEVRAPAPGSDARRYRLLLAPLLRALLAFLRAEAAGEEPAPMKRRPAAARRTVRLGRDGLRESSYEREGKEELRVASYEKEGSREQGTGYQGTGYQGLRVASLELRDGRRVNGNGHGVNGHGVNGHGVNGMGEHGYGRAGGAAFSGDCWEAALGEMRRKLPARFYERWLRDSRFAGVEGDTVVVEVDTMNAAWWVNTRLSRPVERAVNLAAKGTGWLVVEARARSYEL